MYESINALAHTWQWTAFFLGLCLVQFWRLFLVFRDRIRLQRKRKSFETYAETGQVDEAFDSLTGAGAEAAGRAHAATVAMRLHGRSRFQAISDCPKCGWVDVHPLRRRNNCVEDRTVIRTCNGCNFEWWES